MLQEAVKGLATQYPEVKPDLMAATTTNTWDEGIRALNKAVGAGDGFSKLREYISNLLSRPFVKEVLQKEGMMGTGLFGGAPRMTLYIHHAGRDEVAPVQDVRSLVDRYCGYPCPMIGVSLMVNETKANLSNPDQGPHYDEGVRGLSLALDTWLPEAFSKKDPLRGCYQSFVH
ncbi:hypothetical protein V8F20_012053 [Naviculisporaceae sp. PSN 640]